MSTCASLDVPRARAYRPSVGLRLYELVPQVGPSRRSACGAHDEDRPRAEVQQLVGRRADEDAPEGSLPRRPHHEHLRVAAPRPPPAARRTATAGGGRSPRSPRSPPRGGGLLEHGVRALRHGLVEVARLAAEPRRARTRRPRRRTRRGPRRAAAPRRARRASPRGRRSRRRSGVDQSLSSSGSISRLLRPDAIAGSTTSGRRRQNSRPAVKRHQEHEHDAHDQEDDPDDERRARGRTRSRPTPSSPGPRRSMTDFTKIAAG